MRYDSEPNSRWHEPRDADSALGLAGYSEAWMGFIRVLCVVGGCHDNTHTVAVQAFLKTSHLRHENSCVDTNDPHGSSNLYWLKAAEISKVKVRNKSRGNFDLNMKRLWGGTRVSGAQRQISLNHTATHNLSACLCVFSFSFHYSTTVCWLQGYDSMSQTEYWFTIWLVYK